jgi:hypothetical protein
MSNSNQKNQASQGCCSNTNESFDCAAIMERFKNCCESTKPEDQSGCCAEILQTCCGTSEAESKE